MRSTLRPQGGSRRAYLPPADRAFDVRQPITVYRLIGRRPSQVYVDDSLNPGTAGQAKNRLSDPVYWRTEAVVGDQIQERPGTTLLVASDGQAVPILLAEPRPLEPATAFVHAQEAADADRRMAKSLVAEGKLEDALPMRVKGQSQSTLHVFDEQHPLVVSVPPAEEAVPAVPERRDSFQAGRRFRPR